MICVVRMGSDRRTQQYVARRTAEGKSKREIMRCLKLHSPGGLPRAGPAYRDIVIRWEGFVGGVVEPTIWFSS
jgi:hypothetical protein